MFAILNDVIAVQTKRLRDLPARLEKVHLRDYAQVCCRLRGVYPLSVLLSAFEKFVV